LPQLEPIIRESQMRLNKATFFSGLAAGYILGTKAGRERYEQLRKLARSVSESPAVQQAAGAMQAQATSAVKSTWSAAAAEGRKGAARIGRRMPGSRHQDTGDSAVPGNGSAARSDRDEQRPFIPANGEFTDRGPA
jgi:hypothetical protein